MTPNKCPHCGASLTTQPPLPVTQDFLDYHGIPSPGLVFGPAGGPLQRKIYYRLIMAYPQFVTLNVLADYCYGDFVVEEGKQSIRQTIAKLRKLLACHGWSITTNPGSSRAYYRLYSITD